MRLRWKVASVGVLGLILAQTVTGYWWGRQRVPEIRYYGATGQARVATVFLPAVGNSGATNIAPYLKLLRQYGPVLAVTYRRNSFDDEAISRTVIRAIRRTGMSPVFMGQSLGAPLGMKIMRDYQRLRAARPDLPQIAGFYSDCGFADSADVRPQFLRFFMRVPGGFATNAIGRVVKAGQDRIDQAQRSLPHGDSEALYRQHLRYMAAFPWQGYAAQLRFIWRVEGAKPGEFAGIPAMLVYVRDDILINENTALPKLAAAFPGHQTAVAPGNHANFVEYPGRRRAIMRAWYDQLTGQHAGAVTMFAVQGGLKTATVGYIPDGGRVASVAAQLQPPTACRPDGARSWGRLHI